MVVAVSVVGEEGYSGRVAARRSQQSAVPSPCMCFALLHYLRLTAPGLALPLACSGSVRSIAMLLLLFFSWAASFRKYGHEEGGREREGFEA